MKQKTIGWSQRYVTALRKPLKSGRGGRRPTVVRPEQRTVFAGPATLELARIYEQAFAALDLSQGRRRTSITTVAPTRADLSPRGRPCSHSNLTE